MALFLKLMGWLTWAIVIVGFVIGLYRVVKVARGDIEGSVLASICCLILLTLMGVGLGVLFYVVAGLL